MRALGLDPSLRSYGYAIIDTEKTGTEQLVYSGHVGTLPTSVPVARFMHFRSMVDDLLNRFSIDVVGLESPAYGGGPFSENHFGLMMFSREAIFHHRKDLVLYDPSTLKYLSTGNSKADKADMLRSIKLDMMTTQDFQNDEVDAYFVAKYAARMHMLRHGVLEPSDLSKYEKRVFIERTKKIKGSLGKITKRTAYIFRENSRYFAFSKVPPGDVLLPNKDTINQELLDWLEAQ